MTPADPRYAHCDGCDRYRSGLIGGLCALCRRNLGAHAGPVASVVLPEGKDHNTHVTVSGVPGKPLPVIAQAEGEHLIHQPRRWWQFGRNR